VTEGDRINCADCTETEKAANGCNGEERWHIGGLFLDKCPEKMLMETGLESLVNAYWMSKRWGLPFSPLGWAEHPKYIVDSFAICGNEHEAMRKDK